jgi:glycosyltransferase involved in cell wall biosynthesis
MNGNSLTVLMPVYNASRHLRLAINSILNQSFTDFEFLIIDDASTDLSVEILRSYSDPRIKLVINETNLGISKTLNKGIEMASCELIARMDADDISYPQRLQLQFEYFKKHPETVLLSTSVKLITNDGDFMEEFISNRYYNCYFLNFFCVLYHPTIMYKKSAILSNGGYTMTYSEDFDLWWRLLTGNNIIGHIDTILLDYRYSDTSLFRVLKKKEYELAILETVTRNLKYYTGDEITLSHEEIDFLQNHFEPILKMSDTTAIINCFKKLDFINDKIFHKPNINYTSSSLRPYAAIKKETSFYYYYTRLPRKDALYLLLSIYPVSYLFKRMWVSIKRYRSRFTTSVAS